jgi:hypothetical protein
LIPPVELFGKTLEHTRQVIEKNIWFTKNLSFFNLF